MYSGGKYVGHGNAWNFKSKTLHCSSLLIRGHKDTGKYVIGGIDDNTEKEGGITKPTLEIDKTGIWPQVEDVLENERF